MAGNRGLLGHRWRFTWLPVAIICLLVFATFRGVWNAGLLLWDDDINIQNNVHLRGLTWENVKWMFTDVLYVRRYTPLAWLNWSIDHELFGLTPRSCHVGNLLLHAVNSVLVFFLTRKSLGVWLPGSPDAGRWPVNVAAVLGSLIWAVHPLRVEVVAWASGRIYCQTAFFVLLSTLLYLQMATAANGTRRRRFFWWGAVVALAMSLMTYPLALTHVGVLVILDIWVLKRFRATSDRARDIRPAQIWIEKIPFLVVTLTVLVATLWARLQAQGLWQPPPTLEQFGVMPRIMQAFYIWGYYLWKPLWPFDLAPVYTTLVWFHPGSGPFLASLMTVVLITAGLLWQRRRWPGALAIWLIHLVMLTPMLGLTEHPHYANDRYSYLVAVPWSVALAVFVVRAWNRRTWRGAAIGIMLLVTIACSFLSARQVGIWRDSETLFRYLLQRLGDNPYRFDIAMRLGNLLGSQGKLAEATAFYVESLRINPASAFAHNGLAKVFEAQGKTEPAIAHFSEAVRLDPKWDEPHEYLGRILIRSGRAGEAAAYLAKAVQLTPANAELRSELGVALINAGRGNEALQQFEMAVRINPSSANALANLGVALILAGRPADAIPHCERALQLNPANTDLRVNLGDALRAVGRTADALAHYEAALKRNPSAANAHNSLGLVRATTGRVTEAIAHFSEAIRLNPALTQAHFNLGLAYRDTSRQAEARTHFETALRLKPDFTAARDELARLPSR